MEFALGLCFVEGGRGWGRREEVADEDVALGLVLVHSNKNY